MARKTGPLSKEDERFVLAHASKLTPEEIAEKLNRVPKAVVAYLKKQGVTAFKKKEAAPPAADKAYIRTELRNSERWKKLKDEFTEHEISFFEEEFTKLMAQFARDEVLATEEGQIFDIIKLEILKSRNLAERLEARADIKRLTGMRDDFLSNFNSPGDMDDGQKQMTLDFETQVQSLKAAEQSRTTEFVKLQERQEKLLHAVKGTRDQRVKEIDSAKDTIVGLIKMLQKREVQEVKGREMELMKMANEKEYKKLGELVEYDDGNWDRPILSPETVGLGETVEEDNSH